MEDSLFATLDPTVRRCTSPGGREFTLADTVGFVRHLPHALVEAFRSTLEEVTSADLILHVVDGSDSAPEVQIAAVREVLNEIGAGGVRELIVINKADAADPELLSRLRRWEPDSVVISARTGEGLAQLLEVVEGYLPQGLVDVDVVIPYSRGDLVSRAHREGEGVHEEHTEAGTRLTARVPEELSALLSAAAGPRPA